jgi:hypothetical protein
VLQPPTVTALSQQVGKVQGGETVTITGTNFTVLGGTTTAVKFGAVNATSFTIVNATTLTCVTPAQFSGTVTNVIVTTTDGVSPATAANQFIYRGITNPIAPMLGM